MSATILLPNGPGVEVEWKPVEINGGGLTTHISISLDGETILTCGDVDGTYLFDDDTERWQNIQEPLRGTGLYLTSKNPGLFHNAQGPTDVRVAPSDSDRIYYFSKPAGIDASVSITRLMRSDDRGQSFLVCPGYSSSAYADANGQQVMGGNSVGKFKWAKIGIDPSNPDVIYVPFPGAGNKPKMSEDGGVTFSEITGLPAQINQTIGAVSWAIDPSSAIVSGRHQRIIVWMDLDAIYETTDGGANWTDIKDVSASALNDGGAFGPDGVYYVAITNDGVYRYDGSWTEIFNSATNVKIAVHPVTAGRIAVLAPSSQLKHSLNHGDTFTNYNTASLTFTSDAPWQEDQYSSVGLSSGNCRSIAWNPAVTDELWICAIQGICRGTLNSSSVSSFEVIVGGIEELVGNEVVHVEGKSHINVFNWDEAGFKMDSTVEGLATPPSAKSAPPAASAWDAGLYNIWQAAVDPQNTDLIAVCGNKRSPITLAGNGYSTDAGLTWNGYANNPGPSSSDSQFQMICVNDGVALWIDGHNSGGSKFPMRSADLGATAWTQLTASDFPGHTGVAASGFSTGSPIQLRLMAADSVNPDVFYINNMNTADRVNLAGIWRSTDRGLTFNYLPGGSGTPGSGTPLSNPWYNNSLIFGRELKAVPGHEGHLILAPSSTSGPVFPAAGHTLNRSTDGGETWSSLSADVLQVHTVGFGKAEGSYPTIFFHGYYKGFRGIYRLTEWDISTIKCLVSLDSGRFPVGIEMGIQCIEGDKDVFGRCYVAFGGHGFAYADLVGEQPEPEPTPAPTPTPGGGHGGKGKGSSPRRGLITAPPRIKWSKKKRTSAVAEVTEAVKQVAEAYPQYKMDFAEEWRHIANLLLADNTLRQLRKIESAKVLADKIAQVIEEDDEEVLLLM